MIKVITTIGAVVEVDDGIYEANSHILKKFEEGDEVESAIITFKEEGEDTSTSPEDPEVAPEAIIDENAPDAETVEAPEEVIEEANTEVSSETIVEPTPEVTPENGNEEIIAQAKTKATKAPKTK